MVNRCRIGTREQNGHLKVTVQAEESRQSIAVISTEQKAMNRESGKSARCMAPQEQMCGAMHHRARWEGMKSLFNVAVIECSSEEFKCHVGIIKAERAAHSHCAPTD
jgi:hypothetical protein